MSNFLYKKCYIKEIGSNIVKPGILMARAGELTNGDVVLLYSTYQICGEYLGGALWWEFNSPSEYSHWSLVDGNCSAANPMDYDPNHDDLDPGFEVVAVDRREWAPVETKNLVEIQNAGTMTYEEMRRTGGEIFDFKEGCDMSSSAAENFINSGYETEITYSGRQSYHFHHEVYQNMALDDSAEDYRIGVELEIVAKNSMCYEKITRMRSNWFYMERDGSLPDRGVEVITVPLRVEDARDVEFWRPLCTWLSALAGSDSYDATGLHVHIGRRVLTGETDAKRRMTLGKLLYFYHHIILDGGSNEERNARLYGRAHGYHDPGGKTSAGEFARSIDQKVMDENRNAESVLANSMLDRTSEARYFDINLQNSRTIEFRKGKGTLKAERIAAIVQYNEAMLRYVQATPWGKLSYEDFCSQLSDVCKNVMGI